MIKAVGSLGSSAADGSMIQDLKGQQDQQQQHHEEEAVSRMLAEVRTLDQQKSQSSRYRHLCRRLEPLIKFLVMYAPAVDILVQFDSQPSALVWGSLKAVLNVGFPR